MIDASSVVQEYSQTSEIYVCLAYWGPNNGWPDHEYVNPPPYIKTSQTGRIKRVLLFTYMSFYHIIYCDL